jgi:hypothetical protein
VLQVRATAEVLPVAVPVHAQGLIARDRLDQLDLVGLVVGLVELHRAVALPDLGGDGIAAVDDLAHLGLDLAEVFGGEGLRAVEIVIPAVFDDGADGDLHVRPDLLHGAGHDMGEVVADQLKGLALVLHGVNGDLRVGLDGPLQVMMGAVHGGADGLFRKARRDIGRDLGRGHTSGEVARIAIGKSQGNMAHRPVSSSVWRLRNARLRVWMFQSAHEMRERGGTVNAAPLHLSKNTDLRPQTRVAKTE